MISSLLTLILLISSSICCAYFEDGVLTRVFGNVHSFEKEVVREYDVYAQCWVKMYVGDSHFSIDLSSSSNLEDSKWSRYTFKLGQQEGLEFPVLLSTPEYIMIGANILKEGHFSEGAYFIIAKRELKEGEYTRAFVFEAPSTYAPRPVYDQMHNELFFVGIPSESQEKLIIEKIEMNTLERKLITIPIPLFLAPLGSETIQLPAAEYVNDILIVRHTVGLADSVEFAYELVPVRNQDYVYSLDLLNRKLVNMQRV